MQSWISYGEERLEFKIPEEYDVNEMILAKIEPKKGPAEIIRESLDDPIQSQKVEDMVRPTDKICIICDDITRPTPCEFILDELMPRLLKVGVPLDNIFILIALGSHRKMTEEELIFKLGEKHFNSLEVIQAEFISENASIEIGKSSKGKPILVQKRAVEADFIIGIGNIVPHNTLGWSGGAKIVFPGIADESSVAQFHMEAAIHRLNLFGEVENSVRDEVEKWAKFIGLDFIINTILSRDDELLYCVSGHYIKTHREGVKLAKEVYGVAIKERADVVIVDMEPYSFDFWQGTKGLNAAIKVVKAGGHVIICGPCGEGVGPHPEYLDYMGDRAKEKPDEVIKKLGHSEYDPLAISVGYMMGRDMQNFSTYVLSEGIKEKELQRAKVEKIDSIGDVLGRISGNNKEKLKLTIIRNGGEVLPLLEL